MIERLAGKVLQRLLAKYCDVENQENITMGVWSGFVSLKNVSLKEDVLSEILAQRGIPIKIHKIHISRLEITIPWNQLGSQRKKNEDRYGELVVLVDGVRVLLSTSFDFDDGAMNQYAREKRRKALAEGFQVTPTTKWKETMRRRLQDGLLHQIASQLQIHIRNLHVRLENSEHEFALGAVCESMHLQHDDAKEKGTIPTVAQINHFGIYLNAVGKPGQSIPIEQSLLSTIPIPEAIMAMDRTIARRGSALYSDSATTNTMVAPKHTYLLVPVDSTIAMRFSMDPHDITETKALSVKVVVHEATWSVRDFQCVKLLVLFHEMKEHNYRKKHFRKYRPRKSVQEDPAAWWRYCIKTVRYELREHRLRWSWGRFRRRFNQRKRYFYLYERKLLAGSSLDRDTTPPFSEDEKQELSNIEDGLVGDLATKDILLFQAIVKKQLGPLEKGTAAKKKSSWLNRAISSVVSNDREAEEEFDRLVAYLNESRDQDGEDLTIVGAETMVAISLEVEVQTGRVSLFSPISSTNDLSELRRIQEQFIDFNVMGSSCKVDLMGDFESFAVALSLQDFSVHETRSDRSENMVISKTTKGNKLFFDSDRESETRPLVHLLFRKSSLDTGGDHKELNGRVLPLRVDFRPESEWISRTKLLVRPIPQLTNLSKFWSDLSMANINSWASKTLSLNAKAQTALSERSRLSIDVKIDCPCIFVYSGSNLSLLWDLGQAVIRTGKQAGLVDKRIVDSLPAQNNGIFSPGAAKFASRAKDDLSWKTPPRLSKVSAEGFHSPGVSGDFVKLDSFARRQNEKVGSIHFESSLLLDGDAPDGGSVYSQAKQCSESIFYDVFEVRISTGALELRDLDEFKGNIVEDIEVYMYIYKSIIPADRTLSKLKVFLSMERIQVALSALKASSLSSVWNSWRLVFDRDLELPYSSSPTFPSKDELRGGKVFHSGEDEVDVASAASGNVFFDAVDGGLDPANESSTMFNEAWISDSRSVLDIETRSFSRSLRSSRRRPRSVSDLSSLSDTSVTRKRQGAADGYLNAENLVKLEEMDESNFDNDDQSFHSAVSVNEIINTSKEIEQSISDVETKLSRLRSEVRDISSQKSPTDTPQARHQLSQQRRAVQVEADRLMTELSALRNVHCDLQIQIQSAVGAWNNESPQDGAVGVEVADTVKAASVLLSTRRKEESNENGHALVGDAGTDHFQLWLALAILEVRYYSQDTDSGMSDVISFDIQHSSIGLKLCPSSSRIIFRVGKCFAGHRKQSSHGTENHLLLCGGPNQLQSSRLLTSIFPQYIVSPSTDQKLLEGTLELSRQSGTGGSVETISRKVRIAVGDIEVSLHGSAPSVILSQVETVRPPDKNRVLEKPVLPDSPRVEYLDAVFKMSSLRFLGGEETSASAALALTGLAGRYTSERTRPNRVYDRSQARLCCENIQVISISDYEDGVGEEVFSRQDLYNNFLDVSFRMQVVPRHDLGGWVVGNPQQKRAECAMNELFVNIHTGIVIDSFESHISARSLSLLLEGVSSVKTLAQSFRRHTTPDSDRSSSREGKSSSQVSEEVRWRFDLSIGKSFVMLQNSSPINNCSTLLATARLRLMAQLGDFRDGSTGITVMTKIGEVSISVVSAEAPIIAPLEVLLKCELPLFGVLPGSSCSLQLPDTNRWRLNDFDGTHGVPFYPHSPGCNILVCQVSPVEINTWATGLLVTESVAHEIAQAFVLQKGTKSVKSGGLPNFLIETSIASCKVQILKDAIGKLPAAEKTTNVFSLVGVELRTSFLSGSSTGEIEVAQVSAHDLTCDPAVRVLAGETSKPEAAFFTLKWETHSHGSDRPSFNLDCQVARLRLFVCPSFFVGIMELLNRVREFRILPQVTKRKKSTSSTLVRPGAYTAAFCCDMFELVLPSQDLAIRAREAVQDDVGAVVVRVQPHITAKISLIRQQDMLLPPIPEQLLEHDDNDIKSMFDKFIQRDRTGTDVAITADVEVSRFSLQILRTCFRRIEQKGDYGATVFGISGSEGGEQRITNRFELWGQLNHVAVWSPARKIYSFANSLDIKFGLVDVLLYINQSSGGLTDAVRVCLIPTIDAFKRDPQNAERTKDVDQQVISGGPTVLAVRGEGLQITCVPGGATRLTESPIVKLVVCRFKMGASLAIVATDDGTGSFPVQYIIGGWTTFLVSADYHNRSLVVWEPLLEPWQPTLSTFISLKRSNHLLPSTENTHDSRIPSSYQSPRVPRLKEIGRLLRSPFLGDTPGVGGKKIDYDSLPWRNSDLCYLILVLTAPDTVLAAQMLQDPSVMFESSLFKLYSVSPEEWLVFFTQKPAAGKLHDCMLTVTDNGPLNVNFTGSLIELLFDYMVKGRQDSASEAVPHWIRNDTGLTVRFHEVLDKERSSKGELSPKFTLLNGSELPVSLKRSLSQSCDPHKGFIFVELGNFEDTLSRLDHDEFSTDQPQEERFYFRASGKVPVDTVGLFKFSLDWNLPSKSAHKALTPPGHLLVRVALRGGSKLVTLESPLLLRNTSVSDVILEAQRLTNQSLLWTTQLIPQTSDSVSVVPVPLDLVPYAHSKNIAFLVNAGVALPIAKDGDGQLKVSIQMPKPFSRVSLQRGVLEETDIETSCNDGSRRSINVCGLRIGSIGFGDIGVRDKRPIPEQRILMFRSQAVFWNHLAFPVELHARVSQEKWVNLGYVEVGKSVGWDGSDPTKELSVRIRILEKQHVSHAHFPDWSEETVVHTPRNPARTTKQFESQIRIMDQNRRPLTVNMLVDSGLPRGERWCQNESSVSETSRLIESGSRTFRLYVPCWVVDSTGLNLEYKATEFLAGQNNLVRENLNNSNSRPSFGLNELLREFSPTYLGMRATFLVLMVGENMKGNLRIRRCNPAVGPSSEPWSEPVSLSGRVNSQQDVNVHHRRDQGRGGSMDDDDDLIALRSQTKMAPAALGGNLGTRLLHIFCRFSIQNELGRDIEVQMAGFRRSKPIVVSGDGVEKSLHVYDSRPICFRPKEFGWEWSGNFSILRNNRNEVTFVLNHRMRDDTLEVRLECISVGNQGSCKVVLRPALHLPYRIENRSMLPLKFCQNPPLLPIWPSRNLRGSKPKVILPLHSSDFAWLEPELKNNVVSVDIVDLNADSEYQMSRNLGRFQIDNIVPGTKIQLSNSITAALLSDGPTRVLRFEKSRADDNLNGLGELLEYEGENESKPSAPQKTFALHVNLSDGVGVSLVDWTPQELVYLRLEDTAFEYSSDGSLESINFSIGRVLADNCLWVTPYPVLASLGFKSSKRRKKKHNALAISCSRSLSKQADFEDLTLLQKVEIVGDSSILNVDGNLAESAVNMIREAKELGQVKSAWRRQNRSRNEELRIALGVPGDDEYRQLSQEALLQDDLYSAVDSMATTAIASKLKSRFRPFSKVQASNTSTILKPAQCRKFYVEKFRVSTISAELSWSGSLPVAFSLPRWMRPSLTFEGFPFLLRPYVESHAYGTVEEHMVKLRAHYLSLWRIMDLVVGTIRPIFIFRAVYFTTREVLASVASEVSLALKSGAETIAPAETGTPWLYQKMTSPVLRGGSSVMLFLSSCLASSSAVLRYDASHRVASRGLARARNPRLFAHVDGKDTLVEYVAGENAGKALLSRVRMGVHLGEGYVHHSEEVQALESSGDTILMVTTDRVLLLNGVLNSKFCQVIWEVLVHDLVRVYHMDTEAPGRSEVQLWYLDPRSFVSPEEKLAISVFGLDLLRCHTVALSFARADTLIRKLSTILPPNVLETGEDGRSHR